jgi:hypothetical protein
VMSQYGATKSPLHEHRDGAAVISPPEVPRHLRAAYPGGSRALARKRLSQREVALVDNSASPALQIAQARVRGTFVGMPLGGLSMAEAPVKLVGPLAIHGGMSLRGVQERSLVRRPMRDGSKQR